MIKQKILIVEDDSTIKNILHDYLTQWGFECHIIQDFSNVIEEFQLFSPDLILLDITLPHYNGFYWCQEIRQLSEVPIIFLSSASDNMNIITAMNTGADDFIGKPFDLPVLVAKIKALLRRSYTFSHQELTTRYGEYLFTFQENRITKKDLILDITPNETKILQLLYDNIGQVTKREDIIEKLWQSECFIDSNTLSVNMNRLRHKLDSIELRDVIQTIKGQGYMLVMPYEL